MGKQIDESKMQLNKYRGLICPACKKYWSWEPRGSFKTPPKVTKMGRATCNDCYKIKTQNRDMDKYMVTHQLLKRFC